MPHAYDATSGRWVEVSNATPSARERIVGRAIDAAADVLFDPARRAAAAETIRNGTPTARGWIEQHRFAAGVIGGAALVALASAFLEKKK